MVFRHCGPDAGFRAWRVLAALIARNPAGRAGRGVHDLVFRSRSRQRHICERLTITPGNGQLDISWPLLADVWILESTASLTPPITWTPVTTGITHAGLTNSYSITGPTGNQFYRLAHP